MAVSARPMGGLGLLCISSCPAPAGSCELVLADPDLARGVLVVLLCVPGNAVQHPARARGVDKRVQKHPTHPRLRIPPHSPVDGLLGQLTGEVSEALLQPAGSRACYQRLAKRCDSIKDAHRL